MFVCYLLYLTYREQVGFLGLLPENIGWLTGWLLPIVDQSSITIHSLAVDHLHSLSGPRKHVIASLFFLKSILFYPGDKTFMDPPDLPRKVKNI